MNIMKKKHEEDDKVIVPSFIDKYGQMPILLICKEQSLLGELQHPVSR